MKISVIGGGSIDKKIYKKAEKVGKLLADRNHSIVCGGKGGVMEAVCKGAKKNNGLTVGILPEDNTTKANQYIDIALSTGLGNARNVIVVMNGDVVVSIDGGAGTLSEIGHSLDMGKPVIGLETHDIPLIEHVNSPKQVVKRVEEFI